MNPRMQARQRRLRRASRQNLDLLQGEIPVAILLALICFSLLILILTLLESIL